MLFTTKAFNGLSVSWKYKTNLNLNYCKNFNVNIDNFNSRYD